MPLTLDAETQDKLAAFKVQSELTVGEVVAVHWPAPDGTKYYGSTDLSELPNFRNILNHIPEVQLRLPGRSFPNVVLVADVSDEQINLNYWDADGEITRLFRTHGEGVKVELLYFFPQLDWLVPHWLGHFQPPSAVDLVEFSASAASGFRSAGLPLPHRIYQHPCQNQYPPAVPLLTQEEIDESGCPVNRHIGGTIGNLDPATGQVWAKCAKTIADCNKIVGDTKSYTGIITTVAAVAIQTHGQTTFAASKGNETTLKQPIRVLYGGPRIVRALDLLAYRQEHNTAHPNDGFLAAHFAIGEGPLNSISVCSINQALVGSQHLNTRLGTNRQPATAYAPDVSNYSYLANFFGRIGPLNPGGYNASNITGQCTVEGLANIRVYSTPTQYVERYSDLRGWCLLNLYHKWRYGHGVDINRFVIPDWIDIAESDAQTFNFTDPIGNVWTGPRNKFSADLQGRSAQEQLTDICKFGRYTMPFQHFGKIRILPLRKEPLEDVPVFTDEGPERNILRTGRDDPKPNMPRIYWSRQSDAALPNEILITFEDSANGNIERPQTFADEKQQLKAGRAYGDSTLRVVRKLYSAVGLTLQAQIARIGWLLYHLGEFDTGGTKNNYQVRMYTTFQAGFPLYQSQVIKIDAELVRRSSPTSERPQGFTYFRVIKKTRQPDLSYEVICQAYPEDYYDELETVLPSPSDFYEAEAPGNTRTGSAVVAADAGCSGGEKVVGLGNGSTLRFNGIVVEATRLHQAEVYYKSDTDLDFYVSVNGGAAQMYSAPASGDGVAVVTILLGTLSAVAGHTITFLNPNGAVPDLDGIRVLPVFIDPIDPIEQGGVCNARLGDIIYEDGQLRIPVLPCE
jgi:hypothetical protein